jgi:hypothetical protein
MNIVLKRNERVKMKEKLAIIGASYLQLPLIEKAKEMGFETHVFAWKANDVGETAADYFYPISIVEKETQAETVSEKETDEEVEDVNSENASSDIIVDETADITTEIESVVDESSIIEEDSSQTVEDESDKAKESTDTVSPDEQGRREYTQKEISDSLDEICKTVAQNNACFGIAVIDDGFDGSWENVQDLIYEKGYAEKYPFMTSISMEGYVTTDGKGLICVIPVDMNTSIAINHLDDKLEPDNVLYRHERALPLLIKCDVGTEIPRIQINSVSGSNEAVMNVIVDRGKLVLPDSGVYDLTIYR